MVEEKPHDEGSKAPGAGGGLALDSSIFLQLAESLRLQGRYEEAIEVCQEGLKKMPDALPGRLLLGRCYLERGMIAEAKEELEKVVRGIEECLSVYKLLSQVYLEEKDVDKALEVLRKSLYFQTGEEGASPKVSPLEMGLLQKGSHLPFVTPPYFSTPPPPPSAPAVPPGETAPEEPKGKEEEKTTATAIQTDTLADIYLKQGHLDRALSIYQEVLAREPENAAVRGKYEALRKKMGMDLKEETRKKVQAQLERWLAVLSSR